jgi:hypothetical protein
MKRSSIFLSLALLIGIALLASGCATPIGKLCGSPCGISIPYDERAFRGED